MKTVLVVTHRRGFESDPVIDLLRERDIRVFRFNCDSGKEMSLTSFRVDGEEVQLECDDRRIFTREIAIGWCQQLPPYLDQPTNEQECLQNQNLWALQSAAFDLLPIPWLNHPRDVLRASNKVLQLAVARNIGLVIPATLISNQPDEIRAFAQHRPVVAKNLATPWIVSHGKTRAAYTRIIDNNWLADDAALSFCPVIYQEYHRRKRDFRVVVIGKKSFAASCEPNERQREDVRREVRTGESFVECTFDKNTLKKLHLLMKTLSLDYSAADFMEDEEGNLYFLEVNTCGAWWWLDRLYEGKICNGITDFLVNQ